MNHYTCPAPVGPSCPDLLDALMKTMQGEAGAIQFYACLAEMAPDDFQKQIILKIREDEEKHLNNFQMVFCMITGELYTLPASEFHAPRTYNEGLLKSFQDEQEAYEFYKTVYLCNTDPNVRNNYWDAMMDEAEHGRWFNNLLIRCMMAGDSHHHH